MKSKQAKCIKIYMTCQFYYLNYNLRKVSYTFPHYYLLILLLLPSSQLQHLFNKVSMILNLHFLPPTSLNLPQHLTQFTTFFIQNNIFSLAFCDSALSGFPPTILGTYCCHHLRQTTLNNRNSLALYPGPHHIVLGGSHLLPWF